MSRIIQLEDNIRASITDDNGMILITLQKLTSSWFWGKSWNQCFTPLAITVTTSDYNTLTSLCGSFNYRIQTIPHKYIGYNLFYLEVEVAKLYNLYKESVSLQNKIRKAIDSQLNNSTDETP